MTKLLAWRKDFDDEPVSDPIVIIERRKKMVDEAQRSDRAERLEEAGFTRVEPPTIENDQFTPLPHDKPSFSRLGHLGAYILNVPDHDWENVAREELAKRYEITQNVSLTLPTTVPSSKKHSPSPTPRNRWPWPKSSGILDAHDKGVTGYGVVIGVLDTGCNAHHDELRGKTIEFLDVDPNIPVPTAPDRPGYDLDPDGHGTHVCCTLVGKKFGIAPKAELMVAAVLSKGQSSTNLERILIGLNWMLTRFSHPDYLRKPMIVNMSVGIPHTVIESAPSSSKLTDFDQQLKTLFERLIYVGVLPIAAIGNAGAGKLFAPAYYHSALSVGAVDHRTNPVEWSSWGLSPDGGALQPDLVGYGKSIYAGYAQDRNLTSLYINKDGTSMATPYVSGIAALYASENTDLRGRRLRAHLEQTALPLNVGTSFTHIGGGLVRYIDTENETHEN